MKTRKFYQSLFLLALLLVAGGKMYGQQIVYEPYDFRQVNADGDTLYYRITSDSEPYTVAVTRCHDSTYHQLPVPQYAYQVGQPGFAYPVYDYDSLINIPSAVTHDDVTYTVTAIDLEAFYYQRGIRVVNLPSTIEIIDSGAFDRSSLTEITLQEGLRRINYGAFVNTDIREISLPQSLSYIGAYAFGNTDISRVDLPSGIDTLRYLTFWGCPVEHITFPEGLSVIVDRAFPCEHVDTLVFPSTLRYIGTSQNVSLYPQVSESNCKYVEFTDGVDPLVLGDFCLSGYAHLETLKLSSNIVSFGEGCFSYSSVDTVVVPESIRVIPAECFVGCDSLRCVILPENLDTIAAMAFAGCPKLNSIVLPQELDYIGTRAFYGDSSGIEEIRVFAEEPPVLWGMPNEVFPKTWPVTCTIPCGTLSVYQSSRWGTEYPNITFVEDCNMVGECHTESIRAYPNPTSDFLYIEGDFDRGSQVFIYDMMGRVVGIAELTSNNTELNISHLPEGYYVVKIGTESGKSHGIKVCKKR